MSLGHYSTEKISATLQQMVSVNKQRAVCGRRTDSFKKQSWETWLGHMNPSAVEMHLSQTNFLGEPEIPE